MQNKAKININNLINISVPVGTLLSDALSLHTIKSIDTQNALGKFSKVYMPCGGKKLCKKCRITVNGNVSPITSDEHDALTNEEIKSDTRLACFCKALGDCNVTLKYEAEPLIKSDGVLPEYTKQPTFKQFGIAIDIGTTTLAAHLYSIAGLIAKTTSMNPQSSYGADVISRIGYSLKSEENASNMAKCVVSALNDLITEMCIETGISTDFIDRIVITGNTAMLYLLTQRNAKCLSAAPFEADFLFDTTLSAQSLGINCTNAHVYLPPCISAFVGADITTAILASNMCNKTESALLCDIGTNGEIVLWHSGKLTCCSTAAGPACEGAGIHMGMSGKHGAISHVSVAKNGTLQCEVIGDVLPIGICGSGVIDAISCLLDTQKIDETGYMEEDVCTIMPPVVITQKDVRMIQLAKSAICAGIDTIITDANIKYNEISTFYVAGGFGSFLNINSAANIKLIPPQLKQSAKVIGNSALMGACLLLLNKTLQSSVKNIKKIATTVDLSTSNTFMQKYTDGMFF